MAGGTARQFGGKIYHHDAVGNWKEYMDTSYEMFPKDKVDKYTRNMYSITQKLLKERFPGQKEITLYRGTAEEELGRMVRACASTGIVRPVALRALPGEWDVSQRND